MKSNRSSLSILMLLLAAGALLSGCAVGNKYAFNDAQVGMPMTAPDRSVVVGTAVTDQRPYVLSGNKSARFVGLQRGGFGNPFDVTTASGKPFAEDVLEVLNGQLRRTGYPVDYTVVAGSLEEFTTQFKQAGLTRGLFLEIREWKTDVMMSITLHYDLVLTVIDEKGDVLARSEVNGVEAPGGAKMGQTANGAVANLELSRKLSYLFVDKEIQAALR